MPARSIYEAFATQVAARPDAIAVRDGFRALTYAQLDRLTNTIAAKLPPQPRFVGIVMDHGVEMIASILAVLKRGAAYVPAEPSFPIERIRFMLTEADVDAVITQQAHTYLFQSAERVFVERGMRPDPSAPEVPCSAGPEDLAYVLYTSGTTGTPKGVAVENRNVLSYVESFQHEFHLTPADVMMQHSVCSFDIFVEEVFATLLAGAQLAIAQDADKKDIDRLLDFIDDRGVTVVDGFPYLVADINRAGRVPQGVRLYVSGGDVLRASYCDNLIPHALVYNTYGPSETTCCASYYCANTGEAMPDGTYPVGKPVLNDSIQIVDEQGREVPAGTVGEICISGGGVSRGYLGDHPEQEHFVRGMHGERRYLSGDLGYVLPDGNIAFLHRKDTQVMIDGRRVECAEVENVLVADREIHQAVVCAYEDEQGLAYLVAYIVPAHADFKLSALRARLARNLVGFMIPEFFVCMREIPLTANGKPDTAALPVVLKEGRAR